MSTLIQKDSSHNNLLLSQPNTSSAVAFQHEMLAFVDKQETQKGDQDVLNREQLGVVLEEVVRQAGFDNMEAFVEAYDNPVDLEQIDLPGLKEFLEKSFKKGVNFEQHGGWYYGMAFTARNSLPASFGFTTASSF